MSRPAWLRSLLETPLINRWLKLAALRGDHSGGGGDGGTGGVGGGDGGTGGAEGGGGVTGGGGVAGGAGGGALLLQHVYLPSANCPQRHDPSRRIGV